MPSLPRMLTPAMIRHVVWSNAGKFILVVAVFWALAIAAVVAESFGLELQVGRIGRKRTWDSRVALLIAGIVTAIALFVVVPLVVRAVRLAKEGVQVVGTIRQKLGVTWRSFETVRVSYSFNQQAYSIKAPLGDRADAVGTPVELVVDPRSPGRCMLRENVFPPGFNIDA